MNKDLSILIPLLILAVVGCCRSPAETVLSEVADSHPNPLWILWLDGHRDEQANRDDRKPYVKYFGVKDKDYTSCTYNGLKVIKVTLLSKGEDYIFEIQAAGDIEADRRHYGKRIQFCIGIFDTCIRVFTTSTLDEAVFVPKAYDGDVLVTMQEGKVVSTRLRSQYDVTDRLRLEIDGDRMRIYLPKKLLPERTEKWWRKDEPSFGYYVSSRLALPPIDPIPTNLPDVFLLPEVFCIWYPADSMLHRPGLSWCVDCGKGKEYKYRWGAPVWGHGPLGKEPVSGTSQEPKENDKPNAPEDKKEE